MNEEASQHLSSFDLERLEMGTLDAAAVSRVNEHLEACATCRAELEALRSAELEFKSKVFPRTVASLRDRHQQIPKPKPAPRVFAYGGALACAAAVVLFLGLSKAPVPGYGDAAEHAKGASELMLVARHDGRVSPVDRFHHELAPGDEVRLVLTHSDPSRPFCLVASVDGKDQTSIYFPYQGDQSGPMEHPGRWEVPGSIVLDETPGPERIFAFFSQKPLDAKEIKSALTQVGKGGWDAIRTQTEISVEGARVSSVLIEKTPR